KYFPGEDPVGRTLKGRAFSMQVVGVVANARTIKMTAEEPPALYMALAQMPARFMGMVVRTSGDPGTLSGPVKSILHELAHSAAAMELGPLEESIGASVAPARALGVLMTAFAALALLLAAIGIYGLMTYLAGERTREISIRMAIGADAGNIRGMVLRQTLTL